MVLAAQKKMANASATIAGPIGEGTVDIGTDSGAHHLNKNPSTRQANNNSGGPNATFAWSGCLTSSLDFTDHSFSRAYNANIVDTSFRLDRLRESLHLGGSFLCFGERLHITCRRKEPPLSPQSFNIPWDVSAELRWRSDWTTIRA